MINTDHYNNLKANFLQDRPYNLHLYYQFDSLSFKMNSPNFILLSFSKSYKLIFS